MYRAYTGSLRSCGWRAQLPLCSLLSAMLRDDPHSRLTSQQALQHVYFTDHPHRPSLPEENVPAVQKARSDDMAIVFESNGLP